jgi:hypothetical protein
MRPIMSKLVPDRWLKRAHARRGRSGDWLWWMPFVVLLLPAAVTSVMLWFGLDGRLIAALLAVVGPLAILVNGLLDRRRAQRAAPKGPPAELRERWRAALRVSVTQTRVGDRGQLSKMVRQGDPIDVGVARVDHDSGRPRVRIGGRLMAWSEITRRWDNSPGRLVILGDPGYGKTVAALTLIKHINAHDEAGRRVAELFRLAEWQGWRGTHPNAPLGDWLAERLAAVHPSLGMQVAQDLVDAELILPVLDGLDEIATVTQRRACVEAIEAYAGRGAPHHPFVLTCRAREYYELAPDWVRDDERIVLIGLQPDQIQRRLAEPQIAGRPAWRVLREHQAAGDKAINELFGSPLRLAIALQVYRDRDPSELLTLPLDQARRRLWELLLETNADGYRNATAPQVRDWLAWFAAGMRQTGRQRFMLHELWSLDPKDNLPAFQNLVALVTGLLVALLVGLVGGLVVGPIVGLLGLVLGPVFGLVVGFGMGPTPSAPSRPGGLARRQQHAIGENVDAMLLALIIGLVAGLVAGLVFWVIGGLALGLNVGLVVALFVALIIGTLVWDGAHNRGGTEDPDRFTYAAPNAVLLASRWHGLVIGLVGGWLGGLLGGLLGSLVGGLIGNLVGGVVDGIVFGTVVGLLSGLISGLHGWLYHYWLRWRLAARGVLPPQLPAFLKWCADDERNWLRISDAYEFRHRELLEHLASDKTPLNAVSGSFEFIIGTVQVFDGRRRLWIPNPHRIRRIKVYHRSQDAIEPGDDNIREEDF